jgi:hypothetical protein
MTRNEERARRDPRSSLRPWLTMPFGSRMSRSERLAKSSVLELFSEDG